MKRSGPVPNSNPDVETLMGQIRGFCTSHKAKGVLLQYGLAEKHVYMLGTGAEDLDACTKAFRGRPGSLVLAEDLRAFGPTKKEVSERADALEKADIRIVDILHPEDQSYSALVRRAHNAISNNHLRKTDLARRQGKRGGLGRGISAWNKRDEVAPKWLIDKIVNHGQIPWKVKLDLLAPYFTKATLYRHYGLKPTMGRRENVGPA